MEKAQIRMVPSPGENLVRFLGDKVRIEVSGSAAQTAAAGWKAFLRTNLGRAAVLRTEIVQAHSQGAPAAGAAMHDIPMLPGNQGWFVELGLGETGFFQAKAYLTDPRGWQYWPDGPNFGLCVHPDFARTANTVYCAFVRLFGPAKHLATTKEGDLETIIARLEQSGHTVIPESGKLRDLARELPHIVDKLGCRIIHLLPLNPAPTTYGRFGAFGSPYAALDLNAIDPAVVEFDRRTTGAQQFVELADAVHCHGARLFLDVVINHTGWSSTFHEQHPEWFLRNPDGTFKSPGAWGNVWEDLVELRHQNVALWDAITESLLVWCRRGVDGFRCDAGYMVPMPAWQYIIARVQQEFPDVLFLLEGLGGAWEATEALLTHGGMQWAYSELFQNYNGLQVSGYLDHALLQGKRVGTLVHYSETHDNDRLAAKGREWSLLRNRLCALASENGAYGFTCGVEWLAKEKINVHARTGLAWGSEESIVEELSQLNRLLADHPCFFDGANVSRLSPDGATILALWRESADQQDAVLVLVNLDDKHEQSLKLPRKALAPALRNRAEKKHLHTWHDLLGNPLPHELALDHDRLRLKLPPATAYCLAPEPAPVGLSGESYRATRARAAWAVRALCQRLPAEDCGALDWPWLAEKVDHNPATFLTAITALQRENSQADTLTDELKSLLLEADQLALCSRVVIWEALDQRRITPVPPNQWLLLQDDVPFRATLTEANEHGDPVRMHIQSIAACGRHVACFPPRTDAADATLRLHHQAEENGVLEASIRFLAATPTVRIPQPPELPTDAIGLLTNGRGGMARIGVDLGRVHSKYDCVLGANLHPEFPVDRHVFAKRIRVWVSADGFLSPLNAHSLISFEPGPPASWRFAAPAGDGRVIEVFLTARMIEGQNITLFEFSRPKDSKTDPRALPVEADVRLTVRVDIEDRNFHWETKRNAGAEHHFTSHLSALPEAQGFQFQPAKDRNLRVWSDAGQYHPSPEWCENLPHPVEQSRGQTGSGDAFSPGWFEIPLPAGANTTVFLSAEKQPTQSIARAAMETARADGKSSSLFAPDDSFGQRLLVAARAYLVRRGQGRTVIAGYPWFLDWGRDSLIAARGLLVGGFAEQVRDLALTFARFEVRGTLPNTIHGGDASNRDTSDAPLWFGVLCEELEAELGTGFSTTKVGPGKRTIAEVLRSIAEHYISGTPNRIKMDPASGLIWSPSHFTWMDTNYPPGTPRQGYPVEIQALWIRLLRQLARASKGSQQKRWTDLAAQAEASLHRFFWNENLGWYADGLLADHGTPASNATRDDALRSNCLTLVSLGLVKGTSARRCVEAARRYLVVPGALRSLAPLPVRVPLPVHANHGGLLNDPHHPYWGRYEGDEDTRRKPAYHNGTAWTWTFPIFCEALAVAWEFSEPAVNTAKAYLGSMTGLMESGCLGQIPEVLDGDAPHAQRGCDAQAWGVTEAIRVWKLLSDKSSGRAGAL